MNKEEESRRKRKECKGKVKENQKSDVGKQGKMRWRKKMKVEEKVVLKEKGMKEY